MNTKLYKKLYIPKNLLRLSSIKNKNIKVYRKNALIFNIFLWKNVLIYNGKHCISTNIIKDKIGYSFFNSHKYLKYKKKIKI